MADGIKAEGKLESIEEKVTSRDTPMLSVKVGKWTYSIFKSGEFAKFREAMGKRVRIYYTEDGKYRNYVEDSLEIVADSAPETEESMTKAEWDAKDRLRNRTELAQACIGAGKCPDWTPDDWFNWVYQVSGVVTPSPRVLPQGDTTATSAPVPTTEVDLTTIKDANDLLKRTRALGIKDREVFAEGNVKPTEFAKLPIDRLNNLYAQILTVRAMKEQA